MIIFSNLICEIIRSIFAYGCGYVEKFSMYDVNMCVTVIFFLYSFVRLFILSCCCCGYDCGCYYSYLPLLLVFCFYVSSYSCRSVSKYIFFSPYIMSLLLLCTTSMYECGVCIVVDFICAFKFHLIISQPWLAETRRYVSVIKNARFNAFK